MEYVKRRIAATTSKTEINQLTCFSSEIPACSRRDVDEAQAMLEVRLKLITSQKHARPIWPIRFHLEMLNSHYSCYEY